MRPTRLTLSAFGPFAGTVDVDFERLATYGLFLIHGQTGAGKSTLLDAMTYALFGDAKGGPERSGSSLASTHAPLARSGVTLEFTVGRTRYRLQRYPTQLVARSRGGGDDARPVQRQTEARLERLARDGGVAEVLTEKASDTTKAVEQLLGIGVEQFRQTVVLPQGAFREVVTDEKAREHVLKKLFGTHRFAALTTHLKAIASERQQAGDATRRERDGVLERAGVSHREELERALGEASSALSTARERRLEREGERRAHGDALAAGRELSERFTAIDAHTTTLADLDASEETIAGERERLQASLRAEALRASDERREREREALRAADSAHQEATTALADARAAHASARSAVEHERAPERERRELSDHREAHARLESERERLRTERSSLRTTAERLEAHRIARDRALAALEARRAIARIDADLDALADQLAELDDGDTADDTLLALLRSHAAGMVSAGLEPGAPCPACGSTHHPHPHDATDTNDLHDTLERYQERERRRHALDAKRTSLMDTRSERVQAQAWAEPIPDESALERAAHECSAAFGEAERASARLRELETELEEHGGTIEASKERAHVIALRLSEHENEAEAKARDIERTLAQLPEDATDPDRFQERLVAALDESRELEHALAEATEREADTRGALAGAESRESERAAQRERAVKALAAAERAFDAALTQHGFADEAAYRAARLDDADREALAARITQHEEARRDTQAALTTLRDAIAGRERPDLGSLQAALDAAQLAWDEADAALQAAQQRHDSLSASSRDLEAVERRYRDLEHGIAAAQRLARLAGGTVAGRPRVDLETFVLQRQFHEVLQVGNTHLRRMTNGRYTLHLVRDLQRSDNGLDLEVADHFVDGVRRAAKTLSGGEGFQAALALALGLSDVAQRATHPIEALFIDEGFGSLDRDALDQVTRMLRALPQAAGRMIGIISHVDELKRLLPVQLVVHASTVGSHVEMRVNE